jgi:hypothetical protein
VAKNIKRIWEGRNEREFLGDLVWLGKPAGWRMDYGQRKRLCSLQRWAGLLVSFILVWIKGALHLLGSQEKLVASYPVCLFALNLADHQAYTSLSVMALDTSHVL